MMRTDIYRGIYNNCADGVGIKTLDLLGMADAANYENYKQQKIIFKFKHGYKLKLIELNLIKCHRFSIRKLTVSELKIDWKNIP